MLNFLEADEDPDLLVVGDEDADLLGVLEDFFTGVLLACFESPCGSFGVEEVPGFLGVVGEDVLLGVFFTLEDFPSFVLNGKSGNADISSTVGSWA